MNRVYHDVQFADDENRAGEIVIKVIFVGDDFFPTAQTFAKSVGNAEVIPGKTETGCNSYTVTLGCDRMKRMFQEKMLLSEPNEFYERLKTECSAQKPYQPL